MLKSARKGKNEANVFKIMEGAAYSLSLHRDPELKEEMDDLIELNLPIPVRRVVAHEKVKDDMNFEVKFHPELLGGINMLTGKDADEDVRLVAMPYYVWSHRRIGEMAVWLPRKKVDSN